MRRAPILLVLLALCGCPPKRADLSRGGVELLYSADAPPGRMEDVRRAVERRLQGAKVAAELVVEGRALRVRLPEPAEGTVASVKELLGAQAHLELREVDDGAWLAGTVPEGVSVKTAPGPNGEPVRSLVVPRGVTPPPCPEGLEWVRAPASGGATEYTPVRGRGLDNTALEDAEAAADGEGGAMVNVTFTAPGATAFAELTRRLVRRRLAIVLDGTLMSAPVVNEPISGGRARITLGRGDPAAQLRAAKTLAVALRTGALPAPLTLSQERVVPPK